jgi:Ca2+-binding EF-hand superfamily protein
MIAFALVLACGVAGAASLDNGQLFAAADKNGDGVVSKQEFLDERAKRFDAMDTNHDGWLSQDELAAGLPNWRARRFLPLMFGQFDADGDGRVTRVEFAKAPTPVFDRADANGDGVVSQAEVKAAQ